MGDNKKWGEDDLSLFNVSFKEFGKMYDVHIQLEVPKIVFDNLKHSWISISLAHKAFRIHQGE